MSAGTVRERAETFLVGAGMLPADAASTWTPLTGGVSSDLWRVDAAGTTLCVKAALGVLRVADHWEAPLDRNAVERAWLELAHDVRPGLVPRVLAHDAEAGFFAMEYLEPATHPVWKAELLAGRVDPRFAAAVGDALGAVHAATTGPDAAAAFATDDNFAALRLDPYLRVAGRRNPGVADRLEELRTRTATTRVAVVHGDVSPKNILVGPGGPVLLDAECAWFGDPAFDVAFCMNHLLLKAAVRPQRAALLRTSALALAAAHHTRISADGWAREVPARVATLLPALMLARVDGSSPVEYLGAAAGVVRCAALTLLREPEHELTATVDRLLGLLGQGP